MASEYLDIMDEFNHPTGERRLRSEVHAQGLWHRTVHIYLFREVGGHLEILVHLRSKDKDTSPNTWDTRFGGHVKAGETIEQTVQGELHEEIGLDIALGELIQGEIYKCDGGTNREFTPVYYYRFNGSVDSLKFNDGEIQEVRWMTKEEIIDALRKEPTNWSTSLMDFEKVMEVLAEKLI